LQNAAWLVCTRGTRVDLLPSDDPEGCYEQALGNAVHSTNIPAVTQIYLGAHTLRQAAANGMAVPTQSADR
jgi:hypothetical protein